MHTPTSQQEVTALQDGPSALPMAASGPDTLAQEVAPTLSRNVAFSLLRVLVNTVVALVLPAYLAARLPVETYGAWVLILQLAATVSVLDLGLQTGVSKFIAEHHAQGDTDRASRYASSGFALMLLAGVVGIVLSVALSLNVPRLFSHMPAALRGDARTSILLVGISLSFNLVCSIFAGVFLGLQRYKVPMLLSVVNKLLFAIALLVASQLHGSLSAMGAAVAGINVLTGLLQVVLWRRMASHIHIAWALVTSEQVRQIVRYCFLMGIWSIGMLCVNGLDLALVGRYAFPETAYYSIATQPTNFMITVLSASLAPLLPAASALSATTSAARMGKLLTRTMRYSTTVLLLTGLPLVVYGYLALRVWVGPVYAAHGLLYLRILVLGNIIRILLAPYATMVVGVGKVWEATAAPVVEAVLNLSVSLYLARHLGAVGVAYGTLLAAFSSVAMHFAVSMRFTQDKLAIRRRTLLLQGILRPAVVGVPSIVVWAFTHGFSSSLLYHPFTIALWLFTTVSLALSVALNAEERQSLLAFGRQRLSKVLRRAFPLRASAAR